MSRLEALAEVSRQRLDLSGQRIPTPDQDQLPERRGSLRDDAMQNPGPVYEDFLVQDHDPKPTADTNGSAVDAQSALIPAFPPACARERGCPANHVP